MNPTRLTHPSSPDQLERRLPDGSAQPWRRLSCLALSVSLLSACADGPLRPGASPTTEEAEQEGVSHEGLERTAHAADLRLEVDPFIGSGGLGWGVGSIVPGATHPFGMAKVSPDTSNGDFEPSFAHCGGYWYPDTHIRGFSHNHLVGTGASDQGNFLLMPVMNLDGLKTQSEQYRSPFDHATEEATPGYYAVTLDNGPIRAELTASPRGALHRYTFPSSNVSALIMDVSATIPDGWVDQLQLQVDLVQQTVEGAVRNHGSLSNRYGGQTLYFSAHVRTPTDQGGVFSDGRLYEGQTSTTGSSIGAYFVLTTTPAEPVEVEVGISYVSVEQARLNRLDELTGKSFETLRLEAEQAWTRELSRIQLAGGTTQQRRIFATALYHSMMMPTLYTDASGTYRGFDGQVHQVQGFTYYTDFSLWDTFRTLHPLLSLIAPEVQADFNTSFLKMYEQSGFIDRWPQGNGPTGCMVGDSAAIVIADSYLRGVRGFDVDFAWEALWTAASLDQPGIHREYLTEYETLGYVPVESGGRSTSVTLEYAYADGALARLAEKLGYTAEAQRLNERSQRYANHWNDATGYLQGRNAAGDFVEPFVPKYNAEYYAEGNALQWSWYAPHDVAGLITLFGGDRAFEQRLDQFFSRSESVRDTLFPDMNYWHGNEPDLHTSWLYHFIGKPWKSQQWVAWVLDTKYKDAPDGLDGNDDGGTLSAWYVLSAMGLFPIAGTDLWLVGAPLFTQTQLPLEQGILTIEAPGASPGNRYIQSATWNGQPLLQAWLSHDTLAKGGTLRLELGPTPTTWGQSGPRPAQ